MGAGEVVEDDAAAGAGAVVSAVAAGLASLALAVCAPEFGLLQLRQAAKASMQESKIRGEVIRQQL